MDEYTLEMKWDWFVERYTFPQNGLVSQLFAEVPKPKESKIRKSLPLWDLTPLQCKLPDLGIKGVYYTRGKAGATILNSSPDVDFITYDPYCYEHDSRKYDSLHDSHLVNYFKSKGICGFLKKIDILDDDNYPKCSTDDMNAYRQYLYRIHKNLVKREFNKLLEQRIENRFWKSAQQNVVKNFFQKLHMEDEYIKTLPRRKEIIRLQRLKELKPLLSLKKWDNRLKEIEEQAKDEELRREEMKARETKRYNKVLQNGKLIALQRPMRTLVKIKKQKLLREEMVKKRKQQAEFEAGTKAESYLFNKALQQYEKLERCKQLALLSDKAREIARKKNLVALQKRRKRFDDELLCRKMKKMPVIIKNNDIKKVKCDKKLDRYKRKIKGGLTHILQVLGILDSEQGKDRTSKTSTNQDSLLTKMAHHMIKRAVLINLQFTCRHFVTILINYCLSPVKNLIKSLPVISEDGKLFFPSEQCMRKVDIIPEMDKIFHGFIVDECKLIEEVIQKQNTSGLKAFLLKKQKLLATILINARHLFELVEDRVKLLKKIPDPYHNVPYLREEIMKNRKPIGLDELTNKLIALLTITDKQIFNSPQSGLGNIANILAYSRLAIGYNIINSKDNVTPKCSSIKLLTAFDWDRLMDIHKYMKKEFDCLDQEKLDKEDINKWVENTVEFNEDNNQIAAEQ